MIRKISLQIIITASAFSLTCWVSQGQAQEDVLEQWALGLVDASSEVGSAIGAGIEVIGEANGICDAMTLGASRGWRQAEENGGTEWIELRYATPVFPFSVEVYESLNPGTVVNISVRNPEGNWQEVWAGDDTVTVCPAVMRVRFPTLDFPVDIIRVELNTSLVDGWNEIDAVKLIGFRASDVEPFFTKVGKEFIDVPASLNPWLFADYDHDAWPDVIGANWANLGTAVVLHNEGNGEYRNRSSILSARAVPSFGHTLADYDNDGDLDLYVAKGSTSRSESWADVLYRNDQGQFVDVTQEAGFVRAAPSLDPIWFDYNLDGFLDLYVASLSFSTEINFPNILYRNNGDGTFTDATLGSGLDVEWYTPDAFFYGDGAGSGTVSADFNDDGWPDLYVPVIGSPNRLFLNNGRGQFTDATTGDVGDGGDAVGAAIGDIDNDGDLDIFQSAGGGGDIQILPFRSLLLLNLGQGQFLDVTEGVGLSALSSFNVEQARLVDFDNDGDLDLFTGSPFFMFINDGTGNFTETTFQAGIGGAYSFADYDNDGFLDVWFENDFYRNRKNNNHYLRLRLVGTASNRDGIGARVIAVSDSLRQMKELLGPNGLIQEERLVHFGLGQHTQVDQLEIRWPSGQIDFIDHIPADQEIRIIEGRSEWYPAPRTVWTQEPPAELTFGREVEFSAQLRPTLFEPTATITSVTADLSSLGGPADVSLENLGDGTYGFSETFTVGGETELRDVEVLVLQETSLGEHWINLSRNIDVKGDPNTAVLEEYSDALPSTFALHQNHPNPFNSGTVIRFALPQTEQVELSVFNLAGQKVATLVEGNRLAGEYAINWDGRDDIGHALATGIYFYRLQTGAQQQTQKLLLLR